MSLPSAQPGPAAEEYPPDFWPDVDDLVTEDDTPVDNIFSEKQQRMLTEALYGSWIGHRFVALANVGLFYQTHQPPLVPDVMLSLDVEVPEDVWSKSHRAYFVWEFGKPPDVVIEVVSNKEGHEADTKLREYARIGVKYYAIFDPERLLGKRLLRLYELHGTEYVDLSGPWLSGVGLGLCQWEGRYEGLPAIWLRWCDEAGQLIPTGAELAQREHHRAERLAQRLKELGVDPDAV